MSKCNRCNGIGFVKKCMGHIWYCPDCMVVKNGMLEGRGEVDNK